MAGGEHLCVHCGRHPVDAAWRPFCSERCKLADLGRWLTESYRVPGKDTPPDATPDSGDD